MNNSVVNNVIRTLNEADGNQNTEVVFLIDDVVLTKDLTEVTVIVSDSHGDIEAPVYTFTRKGEVLREGKPVNINDITDMPKPVLETMAMFITAMRDRSVHGENPELELISANKQFFLARESAFVPDGVLCVAGIVDEHNMEVEL